jgi:serine/threonine protein phosphatase PrpC
MTTPQVQNSSAYDCETPQAMQRSNTDMSIGGIYPDGMPAAVTPMERINTDMSVPGAPGDIQNTAEDVIGGQSAVFSDGNPYPVLGFGFCASRGRRPYNEDRLLLSPRVNGKNNFNFFGVLDGHAGFRASEFAKIDLPNRLSKKLQSSGPPNEQDAQAYFHELFTQCDAAFLQKAQASNLQDGTTACTILIHDQDLFCANVGDSEAVLVSKVGDQPKGKKVAQIHKPEQASEANRIRALGGQVESMNGVWRVEKNLSVSRAIGDAGLKKFVVPDPSVTYQRLQPGDEYVIIGSDGLWDVVYPITAASMVGFSPSACLMRACM